MLDFQGSTGGFSWDLGHLEWQVRRTQHLGMSFSCNLVAEMMMMGGAAMAAQLAKQVKDLSDLANKVGQTCLKGDAKATFDLARKRAEDPSWLQRAFISQGPAELGAMADAITAYKKGNATGFGDRVGAAGAPKASL